MEKSLAEKLYEYLKDKYGIQGTEVFDQKNVEILKKIEIFIPGIAKNSDEHKWVAFLEKQNSEGIDALTIGQHWKDNHCSWSRYLEIKNNDRSIDSGWFKIVDNTFLSPEYDFKSLIIFMEVLRDFSKTI